MLNYLKLPPLSEIELTTTRMKSQELRYTHSVFERSSSLDSIEQRLRLRHDGRLISTSASGDEALDLLLQRALDAAPYGKESHIPFVGTAQASSIVPLQMTSPHERTVDEMMREMNGFIDTLRGWDERIAVTGWLKSEQQEIALQTSNGFDRSYQKTVWELMLMMVINTSRRNVQFWQFLHQIDPGFHLDALKEQADLFLPYMDTSAAIASKPYPVIFAPAQADLLLRPIMSALNGRNHSSNASPWVNRFEQQLCDERLNLVDHPVQDHLWTSLPFDSEGSPTRRNVLIEAGRLKGLLLDRLNADRLGMESTGNAGPNGPQCHHLIIQPGTIHLQEMISSLNEGILVLNTLGVEISDPLAGNASGDITLGLKIEKGRIIGLVDGCMFNLNSFDMFRHHLLDLSSETLWSGSAELPYLMLDEVMITAK